AVGRHVIDGERLFALVQEYTTRPAASCRWEAHRQHIDIQYVISGIERMGYRPLSGVEVIEPYSVDTDVAFFAPGTDYLTVGAGMYTVFWPQDVHAPQSAAGEPSPVRKAVIKVAVEQ